MSPRVSPEESVAFAAVGLAVVQTVNVYRDTAPPLKDVRCAAPGDFVIRQLLLDADIFGLIIIACIGGGAAFLTRRWYPLVLSLGAWAILSCYYRSVLKSPNLGMIPERTVRREYV